MADGLGLGQHAVYEVVGQQHGIGLGQLGTSDADDLLAVLVALRRDVDAPEERLVVAALGALVGLLVDRGHVFGQAQGHAQLLGAELEPGLRLGQGLLGGRDLGLQPAPLLAEGIRGNAVALLGVQPQQAHLLGLELGDESRLGVLHLLDRSLTDGHQGFDGLVAPLHVLGAQLDRSFAVVTGDGVLDQLGAYVGAVRAGLPVDAADAEEVGVQLARLAPRQSEGQALAALAAKDGAAQVVAAVLRTFAGNALLVQHHLHAVEGVLVDQRLVTSLKDLLVGGAALPDDLADVVRIAQDALEHGGRDGAAGRSLGRPGTQAEPVQLLAKLGHRILAAGVELERQRQVVVTIGVGGDCGHLAAIGQHIACTAVAEPSGTGSAAVLDLLVEAASDISPGLHRLVLVVQGEHALHVEGLRRVLPNHRLGDGDELGTGLAHQLAGLVVVVDVARPAVERPHDDVVHARGRLFVAAFQLIEHGQEAPTLVQVHVGALARVGVLAHDLGVELCALVLGCLALGVDRQAVAAVVGLHLPLGGNAQVAKGAFGRGR